MISTHRRSRLGLPCKLSAVVLALCAAALWPQNAAMAQGMPPGGAGPKAVGVITLAPEAVPYTRTLPGRAVAFEATDLRPRVSGLIEEILYKPGERMKVGDPMFKIEDASYRAAVASAEAALASAKVDAQTSAATVTRYRSLQDRAVTQADLQAAEAAAAASQAKVASAQAALDIAQLDLDHTTLTSPIEGVAGVPQVSVGALVTANQADSLASITRMDPIYIDVSDSSAALLRLRDRIATGALTMGEKLGVSLTLEDGTTYADQGEFVAPAAVVSSTTGTFDLRVQFPNAQRLIMPGQFLRVEISVGTSQAILVPQRATGRASDGTLTAFVARDGVAQKVELISAGSAKNSWIVTQGVAEGDLLIVDGLTNLSAGAKITTVPVSIDADGAVVETAASGAVNPEAPAPSTQGAPEPDGAPADDAAAGKP